MNLKEALEVLQEAHEKGLHHDLIEYLFIEGMSKVLLSFDEVDQLESLGVYCWYVKGDPMKNDTMPMHYYSIGGSK